MFDVIRSKRYWLALLLVGAIIGIFSFALIGVRNSVKVKQIPVALVNEDKGILSNKFESKLRKKFNGKDSKIKWVSPQKNGFNNQKYYGAFIIRSGFSKELQQQNESLKAQIISQKLTTLQKRRNYLILQNHNCFKLNLLHRNPFTLHRLRSVLIKE